LLLATTTRKKGDSTENMRTKGESNSSGNSSFPDHNKIQIDVGKLAFFGEPGIQVLQDFLVY
jgi:hypothetical protein